MFEKEDDNKDALIKKEMFIYLLLSARGSSQLIDIFIEVFFFDL